MPGGDRTGPMGAGPKTGRAMGFCAGNTNAGFGFGRGCGRGFGRGTGRGFGFRAAEPMNSTDRIDLLKQQKDALQQQIDALEGNA